MPKSPINDVLVLGAGLDAAQLGPILAAHGLGCSVCVELADLTRHQTVSAPAAAAIVAANRSEAERRSWNEALRAGGGLWASTPLIALPDRAPPSVLVARLEQCMGALAQPAFRDPAAADYRLVRLVGLDQARRLLSNLAAALRETLAQAEAGPVRPEAAHRLAGLAGLYGFAELGQHWQAIESGESSDSRAALALTREILARLEDPSALRNLAPGMVP